VAALVRLLLPGDGGRGAGAAVLQVQRPASADEVEQGSPPAVRPCDCAPPRVLRRDFPQNKSYAGRAKLTSPPGGGLHVGQGPLEPEASVERASRDIHQRKLRVQRYLNVAGVWHPHCCPLLWRTGNSPILECFRGRGGGGGHWAPFNPVVRRVLAPSNGRIAAAAVAQAGGYA
jgi:hypothetical protein